MTGETVTRAILAEGIRHKCKLSREDAYKSIDVVLSEIVDILRDSPEVKVPLFGVFFARNKRERIGRNPKTLIEAKMSARRVIGFRVSRLMKERVDSSCKKHKRK